MDNHPHDLPPGGSRPPRRELQGPRPTPLKVRKESVKIRKPPVAPPNHHQQPPQQPPRQPVIIYTVSPKVIHANPSEFMTVVQRLTGPGSTSSSSSSSLSSSSFQFPPPPFSYGADHGGISGGISPAARFASIERTRIPQEVGGPSGVMGGQMVEISGGGGGGGEGVEKPRFVPAGILSPGPGSLPPISQNLFFHDPSGGHINLHHREESGGVHEEQSSTRNYMEVSSSSSNNNNNNNNNQPNNPFSTNNFISPSHTPTFSPGSLDLLRFIFDD